MDADMNEGARRDKWCATLGALSFLAALGSMFLPLLQVRTPGNDTVFFFGWPLILGGVVEKEFASGVYSFSFGLNIPLLVLTQCFLLAAISCLLGHNSGFNRTFSLILATVGFVGICLVNPLVCAFSATPSSDLYLSFGAYMSLFFCALGAALELIPVILRKTKPKE